MNLYIPIIKNYFFPKHQHILSPNLNGKFEIPQWVVKRIELGEYGHVGYNNNEIYISNTKIDNEKYLGTIKKNSDGRVRIYVNYLRECDLVNKNLYLNFRKHPKTNEEFIVLNGGLEESEFNKLVNSFSNEQLEMISCFVQGNKVKVSEQPELILLAEDKSQTFRFVGAPYRFFGKWSNDAKNIILVEEDIKFILYLIPVIERIKGSYKFGFLLLDKILVNSLSNKISKKVLDMNRDIIFFYNCGNFSFYNNPPTDLSIEILNKAKEICSMPSKFLLERFGKNYFDLELVDKITDKFFYRSR